MNSQDILIIIVMGIFVVGGVWFTVASHIQSNKQNEENKTK